MLRKIRNEINSWNFDKKMKLFTSASIIICAMTILIISTASAASSITKKSRNLAQTQIDTLASKIDSMLEDYKATAIAVTMDVHIQDFLNRKDLTKSEKTRLKNDASNTLQNIANLQTNTQFIAVVKEDGSDYLFRGGISVASSRFMEVYEKDYISSTGTGFGTMRMSFNRAFYNNKTYSLNIYQPIYDLERIGREDGLLCINVKACALEMIYNSRVTKQNFNIALIDMKGNIVTSSDSGDFGGRVPYMGRLTGIRGSFERGGSLYVYQRIGDWDYYIVEKMPLMELYKDSINMMVILVLLILVMVSLGMLATVKMVSKAYLPMDQLIHNMDRVSGGNLDIRFNFEKVGNDFKKTAVGFNYMMDRINELMEEVKEEQKQLEQIRFQALQAQISPHFLYNTLDCIHWQAAADGNKEISTLVKALATYYRLCLSKGQDIIPLAQELEHVKSYLTIQNTRYDDIIESTIDVQPELLQIRITKMTLQPLIENSIYHGIKIKEGRKGKVIIRATAMEESVLITVEDSGQGMTQKEIDQMNASISVFDETFGYGVRNVNRRIELLFGSGYGLHYCKSASGGIKVEIRLPMNLPDNQGGLENV